MNEFTEKSLLYHSEFFNCLFHENLSYHIGCGSITESNVGLYNCTISLTGFESNRFEKGVVNISGSGLTTISNSILWNYLYQEIYCDDCENLPQVTYSVVESSYPGKGNIDLNPTFVEGPKGEFYLSSWRAGDVYQSPCINSGSSDASMHCIRTLDDRVICLDEYTSSRDQRPDEGVLDIGYHYPIEPISIQIGISQNLLTAGDQFTLKALITNNSEKLVNNLNLAACLGVLEEYIWFPSWTSVFDYQNLELEPGQHEIEFFNFSLPENLGKPIVVPVYCGIFDQETGTPVTGIESTCFSWSTEK